MRLLAIALLALVLLAGCSQEAPPAAPTATAALGDSVVRSLSAADSLPFDGAGSLRLLGVCRSYSGTGTPPELTRFDLDLPGRLDGVAVEITFPLRVGEGALMLDDARFPLTRGEAYAALDRDAYGECSWAAAARRLDDGRLGLERAAARCGESAASAHAPSLVWLTLEGVLPLTADGTFELSGTTTGSEASAESAQAPMKLDALDFELPMTIDGVDVDVTFRVAVDDETRMIDEKGELVPRLEHYDYEDSDVRGWVAAVRKRGDGLVAVELRVLAPGM